MTACNSRFGLDPVAVDDDRDGLLDTSDNCPTAANPDQEDWDANGIGDACDACAAPLGSDSDVDGIDDGCDGCVGPGRTGELGLDGIDNGCQNCPAAIGHDVDGDRVDDACDSCNRGPNHDEDGDGVFDACDDCPSRFDLAQSEGDGDRLGDACDPDTDPFDPTIISPDNKIQSTRMFEAFDGTGDNWNPPAAGDPPWTIAGDTGRGEAEVFHTSRFEVGRRNLIETIVDFTGAPMTASVKIELYWDDEPCGGPVVCLSSSASCEVAKDGKVTLTAYDGSVISTSGVNTAGKVRIWFRARYDKAYAGGGNVQICGAIGTNPNDTPARAIHGGQTEPVRANGSSPNIAHAVTVSMHDAPLALDYLWFVNN